LLKSRRQLLHSRIAETLQEKFSAIAEAEPEVVARHLTQAGLDEPAIEWWGKAGDQALRRSAFKEATAHFGKAIELADRVVSGGGEEVRSAPALLRQRVHLSISLGNALMAARGYSAPETKAAFTRARELAAGIAGKSERFAVYHGLYTGYHIRGELAAMQEVSDAFLREAGECPDEGEFGVAHRMAGVICRFAGDFDGARQHFETAIAAYDPVRDRDLAFRFGHDPGAAAKVFLGWVLWILGDVERARQFADDALEHALRTGHAHTVAYVQCVTAWYEMTRGDADRAMPHIAATLDLAREHGLAMWLAYGTCQHGWAAFRAGDRHEALAQLSQGIAHLHEECLRFALPWFQCLAAEMKAELGYFREALTEIDAAIAEARQTGQRAYDAEAYRIRAGILLKSEGAGIGAAEEAYRTAIAISRLQKARSFELRAALDLAKLYRSLDRNADAYALLAPTLGGFSCTSEFPEIEQAQSLLAALNPEAQAD
jgi:tetratricopeptide (TPR) repeat protein